MNAHYIVTNSYSCGIGEQNQNALMMGNDEKLYVMLNGIFTIEEISQLEALDIRGGHGGARDINNGCNFVTGCGCGTSQTGCTNNVDGCGAPPSE